MERQRDGPRGELGVGQARAVPGASSRVYGPTPSAPTHPGSARADRRNLWCMPSASVTRTRRAPGARRRSRAWCPPVVEDEALFGALGVGVEQSLAEGGPSRRERA